MGEIKWVNEDVHEYLVVTIKIHFQGKKRKVKAVVSSRLVQPVYRHGFGRALVG